MVSLVSQAHFNQVLVFCDVVLLSLFSFGCLFVPRGKEK